MTARDPNAEEFAAALTRLDSPATRLDAVATRQQPVGPTSESAPTVLDRASTVPPDVARASSAAGVGLAHLPEAIRARYRVQRRLPTAGAEADLFVVETLDAPTGELRVVKLYRYGVQPKLDVLEKVSGGNHEHLVRIFEFGESEGHWYEVMEYVANGTLRQLLRGRALPPASVLDVVREVAIGLEHLHGFGLIHRDLKPENVLVREVFPLDLVITDFGISSITELSQRFTSASRTVRYAAPEALSGVISRAVDYWSLGMIVAEATLGRHPFADLSDERAVMQWLATLPIELSGVSDDRLQNLCRGLLQRDPQQRWGAAEVQRWIAGDATLVAPAEQPVQGASPAASDEPRASAAYAIAGESCWTQRELGVALARNWDLALKDLGRGLVRKWCEREFPSVAIERLFMDVAESQADPNDKLLDVILHLCPDIPPCYRGESLASKPDIAAVLERAKSASEASDAAAAREVVERIVQDHLLERFNLDGTNPLQEPVRALRALRTEGIRYEPAAVIEAPLQGTYPDSLMLTKQAKLYLGLAIALEPMVGERIRADAQGFAQSTAFEFWFHRCLLESSRGEPTISSDLALQETLGFARHWYEQASVKLWTARLSEPTVAPAWRAVVEERARLARSHAASLDAALQAFDTALHDRAGLAHSLGVSPDQLAGVALGRQELLEALHDLCHGETQALQDWMDEVARLSEPKAAEGLGLLSDPGLEQQVRDLLRSFVGTDGRGSGRPWRATWGLLGLLSLTLRGLEPLCRSLAAVFETRRPFTFDPTWPVDLLAEMTQRCASSSSAGHAYVELLRWLNLSEPLQERLNHLAAQARRFPLAAASLLGEGLAALDEFDGYRSAVLRLAHLEWMAAALADDAMSRPAPLQRKLQGPGGRTYAVAFNPDGSVLAAACEDEALRLWDTATGVLLRTLRGHEDSVRSVVFSPDGRVLASGSNDKTLRLWDTVTGVPLQTLQGHEGEPVSVVFSPDGRVLASAGYDRAVRLWDAATGAPLRTLQATWACSVTYSPNGRVLAAACVDGTHRLWDSATGAAIRTLEGHRDIVFTVAFSPDVRVIASGSNDKTIHLWDASNGAHLRTLEGHDGAIRAVAFSPDGRVIASGSEDHSIRLWDAASGAHLRTLDGHRGGVNSLAFSTDGRLIASGSDDGTVRLWEAASHNSTVRIHDDTSSHVQRSPLHILLWLKCDWDGAAATALQTPLADEPDDVTQVAISEFEPAPPATPDRRARPEPEAAEVAQGASPSGAPVVSDSRKAPPESRPALKRLVMSALLLAGIAFGGYFVLRAPASTPIPASPSAVRAESVLPRESPALAPIAPTTPLAREADEPTPVQSPVADPASTPSAGPPAPDVSKDPHPAPAQGSGLPPASAEVDQRIARLAVRFNIEETVKGVGEMLTAAARMDSRAVDQLAAGIERQSQPQRGDRRAARALNAQALDALGSDPATSVHLLHEAAVADPADTEILGNLAYAYLKKGSPTDAVHASLVSLSLTPRRASTWGTMALALLAVKGSDEQAIAAFQNAYRYAGKPEKTIEYLTRLSSDDPDPRVRALAAKVLPTLAGVQRLEPANYAR